MKEVECCKCRFLRVAIFVAATVVCGTLPAQVQMGGSENGQGVRLFNNDRAVLEAGDPRKDLPCVVTDEKPILGFDLKFHAGFNVTVPLRELAGQENLLTILFRVTPLQQPDEPRYFIQRVHVPRIEENMSGDAYFRGSFDLGEGKYHVDWLIRDRAERVCSSYWDVEAALPSKDKQLSVNVPPNTVIASEVEQFHEEPPIERNPGEPLNVKVIVNFAPQNSRSATLQPVDLGALVSILRTISRDPRIGKFSVTAFNIQEQKILYRQANADRIDFPSIGKALTDLKLGTIDLNRLSQKNPETQFLAQLFREELSEIGGADAVIFAGPKALLDQNVPSNVFDELGPVECPVFYMNYNLWPNHIPWRDSIGHAVRHFRGTEYTISRPRDLWYAVSEIVSRVVKTRIARQAALQGAQ